MLNATISQASGEQVFFIAHRSYHPSTLETFASCVPSTGSRLLLFLLKKKFFAPLLLQRSPPLGYDFYFPHPVDLYAFPGAAPMSFGPPQACSTCVRCNHSCFLPTLGYVLSRYFLQCFRLPFEFGLLFLSRRNFWGGFSRMRVNSTHPFILFSSPP